MGKPTSYQGGFLLKRSPAAVRPLTTVNVATSEVRSSAPTREEPFDWVGARMNEVFPLAREITEDTSLVA